MYKIVIAKNVRKDIFLLKKRYQVAFVNTLKELKIDPKLGKPLTRELVGKYSIKIGAYRLIYKLDQKDKIVNVIIVGHRSTVYL
jgi:mRNA interferase RelE/StbE